MGTDYWRLGANQIRQRVWRFISFHAKRQVRAEKDLRALRGLEHWRGAEHGFNVDQSIRAGRSRNKKASKSQTSSSIGKTRGGLNTKIHAIVGKDLRPVAFLLSAGNVDDCTEAVSLLKLLPDLKDCDILADKAYGTKEIR
ncbi:MAG: hypothetical protein EGR49_06225, partial [Prevotella sp.]|nr:hypothetical protein [Prevotella sp.]